VPEMEPELARADIAVVPLRIGSGTRLKILESFAHRIPVVSTTIGADGLDVEDGVHLLLADRPEEFARACRRLIEDQALVRRLVDAAEQRYLERYEWSAAKNRVQQLVGNLAGPTADFEDRMRPTR
jgi:polysaccharide biosynthesis protein PslH